MNKYFNLYLRFNDEHALYRVKHSIIHQAISVSQKRDPFTSISVITARRDIFYDCAQKWLER